MCMAALDELAPTEEVVERRACQGHDKQGDGMPTGALLECLDRVGGQVIGKEVDEQEHEDRPAIDMDGDLKRGVAFEKRSHTIPFNDPEGFTGKAELEFARRSRQSRHIGANKTFRV